MQSSPHYKSKQSRGGREEGGAQRRCWSIPFHWIRIVRKSGCGHCRCMQFSPPVKRRLVGMTWRGTSLAGPDSHHLPTQQPRIPTIMGIASSEGDQVGMRWGQGRTHRDGQRGKWFSTACDFCVEISVCSFFSPWDWWVCCAQFVFLGIIYFGQIGKASDLNLLLLRRWKSEKYSRSCLCSMRFVTELCLESWLDETVATLLALGP